MKPKSKVERFVADTNLRTDAEGDRKILRGVLQAHADFKSRQSQTRSAHRWRIVMNRMRQRPLRIAAVVMFAIALIGVIDIGTGSTALSQARNAANTTLSWLRGMIVGDTTAAPPSLPPQARAKSEQRSDSPRKAVTCAARFFLVSANDQTVWQSLGNRGVEFVSVSTDPEVYYAVLNREQAASIGNSFTVRCLSSPHVTVGEGETAALAITNDAQPRAGLALAWRPAVSSDGKEIQSTLSFHDGHNGFEIPSVCTELGGVVLIRAKGIFVDPGPDSEGTEEVLIRLQVDIQ